MNHIALLLPDLEVGGAQRVMLLLAKEFSARGCQVDVVLLRASGSLRNSIPAGVELVDLGARTYGFGFIGFTLSSIARLATWMKHAHPGVLLSSINGANLVALLVRKIYKMPTRLVIRETASVSKTATRLRFFAMRWLYPESDCVVALNLIMKKELSQLLGVSESKIFCIPNPVDSGFIREKGNYPLTHPWVNNSQYKIVTSVGRLIPDKDFNTLIRAFALLPQELNARLIIIGEGPERKNIELSAKNLGITDRMHLVGFDENPWHWLTRSHLFVLSSRAEGYPNSLLEALVLGLPAVVTRYDDSVNYLSNRYDMCVVDVGDEIMLAHKIESRLLKKKSTCKKKPPEDLDTIVKTYLHALGILESKNNFLDS